VKAYNRGGESVFSEKIAVQTEVDISRLPIPDKIIYERNSHKLSFSVRNTDLELIASIEVLKASNSSKWEPYKLIVFGNSGQLEIVSKDAEEIISIRIKLCLLNNQNI